ncbi:MAG: hypothetical protein A2X56_08990 [Nitrospirae bacterium GWC2_57_13]|nr:MAG: hypothetical protein A2072_00640 [Nitrospirae bacterium GWC1_57_7]OGW27968.1 MAG: hypothetical protein A2X56_08990 [Nitrospirae bacterium GWC2_57_13]HAS55303.1 hypothetical protein [Nitrospiraceae bacterium]
MKLVRMLLPLMLVAVMTASAAAQGAGPGPGPMGGQGRMGPPSDAEREEIMKKVQTVRIWRLTEELKLDEKTSAKLAAVLSSLDQERRELMQKNREAMQELRALLGAAKLEEKRLQAALEGIEKNHDTMIDLRKRELREVRGLLTIEQQARYVVFHQQFRREMRGMMNRARSGSPGGPGMEGIRGGPQGPEDDE